MVHYTTYKYDDLLAGMKKISKLTLKSLETDYKYKVSNSKMINKHFKSIIFFIYFKAVINKYSSSKFLRISLMPELQGSLIKKFANLDV